MGIEEFKNLLFRLINKAQNILEKNDFQEKGKEFPGEEIGENVLVFLDVTIGSYDKQKCGECKDQYRKLADELWKKDKDLHRCHEILNWTRLFLDLQVDEEQSFLLQNKKFCAAGLSLMEAMTESRWWTFQMDCEEDLEKKRAAGSGQEKRFHQFAEF